MTIRTLKAANLELQAAVEYYRQDSEQAAAEFQENVERAIKRIAEQPLTWGRLGREYRRYLVKKFPYSVIYRVDDDEVTIMAFAHLRRHPDYWKKRR